MEDNVKREITAALESWRQFDLDKQKSDMEMTVSTIAENQENSAASRRHLSSTTKEFREVPKEERTAKFGPLLKEYQKHIDQLKKRSLIAEKAYLTLYECMNEVKNPTSALQLAASGAASSSQISELELKNKELMQELEEFRKEFQGVKNREVTVRKLEAEKKELENTIDKRVAEKVQEAKEEMEDELRRKEAEGREKEKELQLEMENMRTELLEARQSRDEAQQQLLAVSSKQEEVVSAKQAEVDWLVEEVNRLSSLNVSIDREKERLQQNIKKMEEESKDESSAAQMQKFMAEQEDRIITLKQQISSLQTEAKTEEALFEKEKDNFHKALEEKESALKKMKQELDRRPTIAAMNELKSKLRIFEAVEYTLPDEYDSIGDGDLQRDERIYVDKMLKEKCRSLETETMRLKVAIGEKDQEIAMLTSHMKELEEKDSKHAAMIAQMEKDIERNTRASMTGSRDGEKSFDIALDSNDVDGRVGANSGSESMLKVVCHQRDRFKSQVGRLEAENDERRRENEHLKTELSSLRSDNVALYEKIRYLQSFSKTANHRNVTTDVEGGMAELDSKYKKMYEDTVNPFVAFNRREKHDRFKELSAAEKVTLRTADFFLAHKFSRFFIFFYSIALHLLVFIMLYRSAHLSVVECGAGAGIIAPNAGVAGVGGGVAGP